MLKDTKAFSGFSVNDVEAAKKFYGETLGVEVSENEAGLTLHMAGAGNIFVYEKENHEPATFTILNFQSSDVPGTVAGLKERGVEFERYEGTPAETDEDGVFRGEGPLIAWFKDPAGNVMSVIDVDAQELG
jgi:catechol 2,3-dioxygenase-like lactoylglutathione lyase family enzyme